LRLELSEAVYALDASAIELGLRLCPWARYDHHRSAVKLHTQLDLRGWLPAAVQITPAKRQEVTWLDFLDYEPGAFYLLDWGYSDFRRLYAIQQARAWFVTRAKTDLTYGRCASRSVDGHTGLRSDQIIRLTGRRGRRNYPDRLRRVRYYTAETKRNLIFLTNHLDLPALLVAQLYQQRWQVELFFRWLKQHLRIKAFYGRSENAVRTQLWIALCVYALVAVVRKQIKSQASLFEILQILSINVFDKTPINELFVQTNLSNQPMPSPNQLSLFN
jgi:IS4 transposase